MRVACVVAALVVATFVGAATATGDQVPRCASWSLRAWAGPSGVGMGTIYSEYGFVNVGARRCGLDGFPGVAMLDGSGHRVPTIVRLARPGAPGYAKRTLITLGAGERAYFEMFYADRTGYEFDRCPTSARLVLTPPGSVHGLVLNGPHARIAPYGGTVQDLRCGIVNVGPLTARPPRTG
jgi:Domain of unknown function (DUF4232)